MPRALHLVREPLQINALFSLMVPEVRFALLTKV
jgi:hypothetical protein